MVFNTKIQAQGKPKIEQTDRKTIKDSVVTTATDAFWVEGTVSDESGPIPGVNVFIKGTTISSITDFNGKYSIKAQKDAVLIFNFMGYKNVEKTIGKSTVIDVILKDGVKLTGEVVFCRKKNFWGRIVTRIKSLFQ